MLQPFYKQKRLSEVPFLTRHEVRKLLAVSVKNLATAVHGQSDFLPVLPKVLILILLSCEMIRCDH
jgi:hypothetical protein